MKTSRVTVETEQVLIIHRAEREAGWCPLCNRPGEFVLLDNACLTNPALAGQIRKWQETGKLHFWSQENGLARICLASLLCCFEMNGNPGIQIAKEVL